MRVQIFPAGLPFAHNCSFPLPPSTQRSPCLLHLCVVGRSSWLTILITINISTASSSVVEFPIHPLTQNVSLVIVNPRCFHHQFKMRFFDWYLLAFCNSSVSIRTFHSLNMVVPSSCHHENPVLVSSSVALFCFYGFVRNHFRTFLAQ